MQRNVRRVAWVIAGATLLSSFALGVQPAKADCADPVECICSGAPADAVLTVTVVSVTDSETEATVDTVAVTPGKAVQIAKGDTVTLPARYLGQGTLVAGNRLLVSVVGTETDAVILIDADEHVTCFYQETYRPTVARATEALMSVTCHDDIAKEMPPVECNDTGGFTKCSAGGAGQGTSGSHVWTAAGALGLGLLGALRRRNQAKKPRPAP